MRRRSTLMIVLICVVCFVTLVHSMESTIDEIFWMTSLNITSFHVKKSEDHPTSFALLRSSFQNYVSNRRVGDVEVAKSLLRQCLLNEFSVTQFSVSDEKRFDQLVDFYSHLYLFVTNSTSLKQKHVDLREPAMDIPSQNVVIIGAGPMGLLSAIEASFHANVTLVEKRESYSRNVWFDFYPEPYSVARDFLRSLGIHTQSIEYKSVEINVAESKGEVILIRCQILERFLSKVLWMLGVRMMYGYEYISHDAVDGVVIQNVNKPSDNRIILDFDLLIGADGSNSLVRKNAKISTKQVNEFQIVTKHERDLPTIVIDNLHQTALIVNFAPVFNESSNTWQCPEIRTDPYTNQPVDPWSPTFDLQGVTSIFKRFYFAHCHLQVLFDTKHGDMVIQTYQKKMSSPTPSDMDVSFAVEQHQFTEQPQRNSSEQFRREMEAYPLGLLLEITKRIFEYPPENVTQLLQIIQRKSKGLLDMTLWDVKITRSEHSYHKLRMENNAEKIVLLRGDAVSTAHFRLGVGVNNAFLSYGEFLTPYLLRLETLESLIAKHDARWDKLIRYMASTMFWESYCDNVVFFNTDATSDYPSNGDDHLATVWRRDYQTGNFDQYETVQDMIKSCPPGNWKVAKGRDHL